MEIVCFLFFSLIGGLTALIVFIYHMKNGQFDDPEEPKYQLFRDENNRSE